MRTDINLNGEKVPAHVKFTFKTNSEVGIKAELKGDMPVGEDFISLTFHSDENEEIYGMGL